MANDENGRAPDTLVVSGLGKMLDGEYTCDLAAMLALGTPESLTNREGHRIKIMAGVTAGQIEQALQAGDNDVLVALAAVVLTRHGKRFDEDRLWDAPMGSGLEWDIGVREDAEDEGGEADPPGEAPPTDGGVSISSETSGQPVLAPSPTGTLPLATPTSDQGSHPASSES